jgi:hypothetical protein
MTAGERAAAAVFTRYLTWKYGGSWVAESEHPAEPGAQKERENLPHDLQEGSHESNLVKLI